MANRPHNPVVKAEPRKRYVSKHGIGAFPWDRQLLAQSGLDVVGRSLTVWQAGRVRLFPWGSNGLSVTSAADNRRRRSPSVWQRQRWRDETGAARSVLQSRQRAPRRRNSRSGQEWPGLLHGLFEDCQIIVADQGIQECPDATDS